MTIWTAPTELPDLRRVGTHRARYRDERRGPARRSWFGLAVARWLCLRHQPSPGATRAAFAAIYFPLRHPDSENFERENVARWLKDHIAAGVRFITQNGLYDWGWLRADLGVAMPPSDQLEEIGALATLIDENRSSYSLDALCAWRGLPGKDTALLEEAVKAAGFKIEQEEPATIVHLAITGAPCRPLRRGRRGRTHWRYSRDLESDPRPGGHARRLSA